jgi:hypothetical protein
MMSRDSRSTAVSGSHIPSGFLANRLSKSFTPQITCVRLSRVFARGRIMWLNAWAMADPCPEKFSRLSRSASRIAP